MIDLTKTLKELGINKSDTLMVHGNAGVSAQYVSVDNDQRLEYFFDQLVAYIVDEGTIVVPAFSYSFTKNEDFNVNMSESEVGQFSENFRKRNDSTRSYHPIFSTSSIGQLSGEFQKSTSNDCFGVNTTFDLLYKKNAKLVCFGCSLDRITFIHYVEQAANVSYRHFKYFHGKVIDNSTSFTQKTRYFVRDLNIDSTCSLSSLKDELKKRGMLKEAIFGRFPVFSIDALDFFNVANEMILEDEYSHIKQESKNDF